MLTETLELTVFHCVVKHGSYVKAAEELALSASSGIPSKKSVNSISCA